MVHKESLALAEDWLKDLPYGSLLNRNNPLVDRTIDRYRDEVVGRPVENRRKVQPQVPLLEFWAKLAPGEPIWAMQREQWLEWVHGVIRDGHGTGTKEPSESQVNNRRSSSKNFVTWMGVRRGLAVDQRIVIYQPAPEDRVEARRKQVKLHPLRDGAFVAIWNEVTDPDNILWMGMAAFMTMRIDEIANLRPEQVDLERHSAEFIGKGRKLRTVRYGELMDDWSYLPYLGVRPKEWMVLFEDHVAQRQADAAAMPPGPQDPPWWVWPKTEGQSRPHRDNKRKLVWAPSPNDLNRFAKRWRAMKKAAGYGEEAFTPHQLRHFASTNMWRAGTPWRKIVAEMGHDHAATTEAYSDFSTEFNRERARNEHKRGLSPE